MLKMKGVEWVSFYNDPEIWKQDVWHDDLVIVVDDKEIDDYFDDIDPKATVTIESGVIYFTEDPSEEHSLSVESAIRKWRRNKKFKTVCVEIPNEMFYVVCEQLKKDGCKIIK
jgi:hypothetical protein